MRSSISNRGHTLTEILVSATLLLICLALITVPFVLAKNSMTTGNQRISTHQALRLPVEAMIRDLQRGKNLQIQPPDALDTGKDANGYPLDNGIAMDYTDASGTAWHVHYYAAWFDANAADKDLRLMKDVTEGGAAVAGSPFIVARGLRQPTETPLLPALKFTASHYELVAAGTWDWRPLLDPKLPPTYPVNVPDGGLVTVQAAPHLGSDIEPSQSMQDLPVTTSFEVRN